ncbi:MAG: lipopolysaccharide assembly protein LapB [Gammaproteobacteria bacterium]
MLELLWLLLPVAAASGWFAARRSARDEHARQHKKDLSSDYFRGLNYLLNEQPDKAIEVFIKMVEIDSETVETHLALGNLFRRRGEVDRAIRIHQNLIARPTLSRDQRAQALLELGEDYMRAGLFDRAESLFLELIDLALHTERALEHLVDIYQQEQDWEQAIAICRRLQEGSGRAMNEVIAQYYCELAERAGHESDPTLELQMIRRALSYDRDCVRASILLGRWEEKKGDFKAAIRAYKRVSEQDIDFTPEIIEPLEECYRQTGSPGALMSFLHDVLDRYRGISPALALAERIRDEQGERPALEFITQQLRKRPSVRGLNWLIELSLRHSVGEAREDLMILHDLTSKLLEGRPVYECNKCGFTGKVLHWQCPSCKSWNSVKPIRGVVGE